jgi:hypothetical protein
MVSNTLQHFRPRRQSGERRADQFSPTCEGLGKVSPHVQSGGGIIFRKEPICGTRTL